MELWAVSWEEVICEVVCNVLRGVLYVELLGSVFTGVLYVELCAVSSEEFCMWSCVQCLGRSFVCGVVCSVLRGVLYVELCAIS